MNIRHELRQLITDTLKSTDIDYQGDVVLDYPADMSMGDFATPIAMQLGKQLGRNPKDVADDIAQHIHNQLPSWIDQVSVAGPGFVNFTLSKQYWADLKQEIAEQCESWGSNDILNGHRFLMEHTSVNLFKPFHIGHLLSNVTGESLNRIVMFSGADTTVISYPSDKSPGIAKAVWGLWELHGKDVYTKLSDDHIEVALGYIGEAYAYATQQYKERPDLEPIIKQITKDIYEEHNSSDVNYYRIYKQGRALSLQYFQDFTKKMGSEFEAFIFESQAEEEGKKIIAEHPDVYVKSGGAVIFEGSKYGLFDNVFINSAGFATYLGKDVGLMSLKAKQYGDHDKWFYVTDTEQKPHFQLMNKSVEQFQPDWANRAVFVHHGRLSLTTGKISSRSGDVPMAEDLINMVKDASHQKIMERGIEYQNRVEVTEKIARASLKYSVLKSQTGKNIILDLDKDLSFEGMSGPYIQYAYVRAVSATKTAKELLQEKGDSVDQVFRVGETPDLERLLVRFPDVVHKSLEGYSPHHIAVYVYELASEFNSFYAQTKIAEAGSDLSVNIQLAQSVAQTIKNALWLLGIEAVEQM